MIRRTARGYQIRYRDADGVQRKETLRAATREEAEQRERELLVLRDRGQPVADVRRAPSFAAFAATWIEERRGQWKRSTLAQYEQLLKSHVSPALGSRRVTFVDESAVRRFLTACADAGLSARRTNVALILAKSILYAAGDRYGVDVRWLRRIAPLHEPDVDIDPLAPDEIARLLAACPPWWRPFFTVSLLTGARPSELAGLRWGDVDLPRRTFRIRAIRYRGVEGTPKTRASRRDVDVLTPVGAALQAQRAQQGVQRLRAGLGAAGPEDHVFTGPEGGLLNVAYVRDRVWGPTLARAELRQRNLYQTRHSFASNALEAGESPQWVARMLGHRTVKLVFEVYAKWIRSRTRDDGSALAAHVGPLNGARPELAMRPKSAPFAEVVGER